MNLNTFIRRLWHLHFFASAYFNLERTAFRDRDVTMHIMVFTRVFSEREMILWSRANVPTIWAERGWAEWRRPVTHPRGQPGSASSGQLRPHTTHSVSSDHPPSEHRSTADLRVITYFREGDEEDTVIQHHQDECNTTLAEKGKKEQRDV